MDRSLPAPHFAILGVRESAAICRRDRHFTFH
jgi:hypothetical protein